MTETLTVKRFGPLKEIVLDLKPTMVFIGPQSSGKSTLAKLLSIFRDSEFLKNIGDDENPARVQNYAIFFQNYNIFNYFVPETYFNYSSKNYTILYEKSQFKLIYTPALLQEVEETLHKEMEHLKSLTKSLNLNKPLVEVINWDMEKIRLRTLINNPCSIYIPAERLFISMASGSFFHLINRHIQMSGNVLQFGAIFESARSLKEVTIDFLDIVYKYEDNQDRIYLSPEKSIELMESATGVQAVVPAVMVIESMYTSIVENLVIIFIIEEPELSLYPLIQKHFVNYLVAKCTITNEKSGKHNELLITTHSPYILAAVNNCLFAYMIAQKQPDKIAQIECIIPQKSWLNPAKFNAYYIEAGKLYHIFDEQTGMIENTMFSTISEAVRSDFSDLMNLYSKS